MPVTSGFFNSIDGDRKYNAEQISEFFGSLITSGVLPNPSTNLQVVGGNWGMAVRVRPGRGFIDCHWIKSDVDLDMMINTADSVLNRIDAIIMKLDTNTNARKITIEVKKGTPSSNPKAPEMTRTESVKEYCLATVRINAKQVTISQADITDTRANASVCGWVTGLIQQVDTTTLFLQWEEKYNAFCEEMERWKNEQRQAYDTWFEDLTGELRVDTHVKEYKSIVNLTNESQITEEIDINISEYNPKSDILIANINGIMLTEGEDYSILTGGAATRMQFKKGIKGKNTIELRVLKSVIGAAV